MKSNIGDLGQILYTFTKKYNKDYNRILQVHEIVWN